MAGRLVMFPFVSRVTAGCVYVFVGDPVRVMVYASTAPGNDVEAVPEYTPVTPSGHVTDALMGAPFASFVTAPVNNALGSRESCTFAASRI
jgi:hypothetical protein